MNILKIDLKIIRFLKHNWELFSRFAIALVFIWFGGLKVLGLSPAEPLVEELFAKTISFMSFEQFYYYFSYFEVLIGLLFLIPVMTRVVMPMLLFHMILTTGPLFILTEVTWSGFLVPTLVGQYIIKNVVIIALAMVIGSHLHPIKK